MAPEPTPKAPDPEPPPSLLDLTLRLFGDVRPGKSIDAKVPAVTVLTEDGRSTSFKVDDKKYLQGLKAGDKVEITYTQAFVVSVK